MRLFLFFLLLTAPLLTACKVDPNKYIGVGDFTMNQKVKGIWYNYNKESNPTIFLVTKDRQDAYYFYCPDGQCTHLADGKAIFLCTRKLKKDCLVYARRKKVVWRFDSQDFLEKNKGEVEEIKFELVEAMGIENKGQAAQSDGAVLYVPGFDGDYILTRDDKRSPDIFKHFSKTPLGEKFHFFRLYLDHSKRFDYGDAHRKKQILAFNRLVNELKEKGYKKIMIAGQSWGGQFILDVLKQGNHQIDVAFVSSPSFFGAIDDKNKNNAEAIIKRRASLEKFTRDLSKIQNTNLILGLYEGDPWMPQENIDIAKPTVEKNKKLNKVWVLDRPKGILGHSGIWEMHKSKFFSDCLYEFVSEHQLSSDCINHPQELNYPGEVDKSLLAKGRNLGKLQPLFDAYKKIELEAEGYRKHKIFVVSKKHNIGKFHTAKNISSPIPTIQAKALKECQAALPKDSGVVDDCRIYAVDNEIVAAY